MTGGFILPERSDAIAQPIEIVLSILVAILHSISQRRGHDRDELPIYHVPHAAPKMGR